MLVKELIALLGQKDPNFEIVLGFAATDSIPLMLELYPEDFISDSRTGIVEIVSDISQEVEDEIERIINTPGCVKPGEVLMISRADKHKTLAERMEALGMSVVR